MGTSEIRKALAPLKCLEILFDNGSRQKRQMFYLMMLAVAKII